MPLQCCLASRPSQPAVDRLTWSHLGHAVHTVQQHPEQDSTDHPALLLVHGFGASTDHWRYNIPVLAQTHAVHAIDLLGFGRSAKPAGLNYGGALWRDQLVAYVRERIGRPTVIAGNSLGGFAALAAGAALDPTVRASCCSMPPVPSVMSRNRRKAGVPSPARASARPC